MKSNVKSLKLVESGFSSKLISKLNENQINNLFKLIFKEQAGISKSEETVTTTQVPLSIAKSTGAKVDDITITADNNNIYAQETRENTDPEISEKKKDKKNNPWAICTAQVGRKDKEKYEKCVKEVKKSLAEGKNPVSLFLEEEIDRIVKKHLPPKITKKDLIQFMFEQNPATAPTKPKERPTTKPGKPDKSPGEKPKNPMRRPGDQPNPGPKASKNKVSPEQAKDEVIDLIINLLEK